MKKSKRVADEKGFSLVPQTIVVRFKEHVQVPYVDSLEKHFKKLGISALDKIFQEFPGMTMNRLYTTVSSTEIEKLIALARGRDESYKPTNPLLYFRIVLPSDIKPQDVVRKLREVHFIDEVYIEGGPTPPPAVNSTDDPRASNQGYLDAAPTGIDARFAWTISGGDGEGIQFVDMEQGWTLNHEDLVAKGITIISGLNQAYFGHGTAVLGEVVAVDNTLGNVGISPNTSSARVISQHRTASNYNTADAILSAASVIDFGDILLLEAQTTDPLSSTSTFLPVEVETAVFDAIRLATALGITVVEAAGNGGNDLDNFTNSGGQQILNRSSVNFRDSGAIMVGAVSSTAPHNRMSFSNYGNRIDCYAWGQNVDTTGDGWTGNLTNTYTSSFGGTSSASPIIAGAASCIQGIMRSIGQPNDYRFSPLQLRSILSNAATATTSANPASDKIGVMPDLRAIINTNLGLMPDVYLRDHPMDDGDPHIAGPISSSPDIIVRPFAVADPTLSFGEGSGVEDSITLGYEVEAGQDNFIYVRLKNRGGSDVTNVSVSVYWSPVASLITPNMWTLIGTINVSNVPTGNTLVVDGPLVWQSANIPATGHYCFVGVIDHPLDPAPSIPNLTNFNNFQTYIRSNNNVTWRNFNVVNYVPPSVPPSPELKGFVPLPFMMVGAPDEQRVMDIEIIRKMPRNADLFLECPPYLPQLLKIPRYSVKTTTKNNGQILASLPSLKNTQFKDVQLAPKAKYPCKLWVKIRNIGQDYRYFIAIRQIYQNIEVGRATWMLQRPKEKDTHQKSL